ncbi:DNA-processing protein DprA [Prochlorothrix hollandica]|uniref:DNA repair protein Smf n=1 Tax=Prochlorothrix hollandica PCC 9006 = CALU 1027 TaxID=317619 RepID=A0A0M2PV60_PROHO|nr:DNA-processing protein DprA [Prochlorothrix hollandica]KKJ00371.1 DNA repair protein Smf [Prochlorothrix hollandica PCC 9006 = CALU 1027]
MNNDRAYWVAWTQINGVGSLLLQRVRDHFGSLEAAWMAPGDEFRAIEGFGNTKIETLCHQRQHLDPLEFLHRHSQQNPRFWTPADVEYPPLLKEMPHYPPVLYLRGRGTAFDAQAWARTVAIVGTRQPSDYGRRWTRRLSQVLTDHGFTIVSGMAAGVDAEAHHSCLQAGGATVGVLGTGVDLVYPESNRSIYEQILRTGWVMSEYPARTGPDRSHFPQRNRIIAGLCRAILVMEGSERSGALITAKIANELGREVYALPGSLDNPQAMGCIWLLSQGAQLLWQPEQLLEALGTLPHLDCSPPTLQPIPPNLEPELAQVIQILGTDPLPFDHVVAQTGLATAIVSSALLQLELMALVTQVPGMRYQRC